MPSLTWVNHASYILEEDGVRLICDPWLSGTAFNRGWRLLSPTRMRPEDFAGVTHIWFSHQHPDHFSPKDLRAIPPEIRARITVLYHQTIDKKIVRFCRGLRFKDAIELQNDRWTPLSPTVEILCNGWSDRDSWMAVRTPSGTILNVNDCVVNTASEARAIASAVGPVRVLLTQFSYANWAGNPDDVAFRRAEALKKYEQIRLQVAALDPQTVIPFASFVWFSHRENFYHNAQMNQVGDVASFLERDLHRRAVVLYPGDRWTLGEPHDWRDAAERYRSDFERMLSSGAADESPSVPLERIQRACEEYLARIKRRNPVLPFIPGLRTSVFLTDTGRAYEFSLAGMRELADGSNVDLEMSSDSLYFALKTPWGANALGVNGRFTVAPGGNRTRFFRFFRAGDLNDHGMAFDYRWAASQVGKALVRRARRFSGDTRVPTNAR